MGGIGFSSDVMRLSNSLFAASPGTVVERKFAADAAGALVGCDEEARWETLVRVVRILETRASIGQSILKVGRS